MEDEAKSDHPAVHALPHDIVCHRHIDGLLIELHFPVCIRSSASRGSSEYGQGTCPVGFVACKQVLCGICMARLVALRS